MRTWCILSVLAAIGCNESLDEKELTAAEGQFAVVSDNYSGATSISLLSAAGEVTQAEWVGSKSSNPELRTPLSDDVVLPTSSNDARYLTTIERGIGVLTRFDVHNGDLLGQLRTDESPDDDDAAYHSNPQDVCFLSERSAWVSRWEQNPNRDADERERGNDLIEWDPERFERTDRRIDLSSLNEEIEEAQFDKAGNESGSVRATAIASPASITKVGRFAAVGITGITSNYNYGPGKVAIVDLERGELVEALALEGLKNCGGVKPVPDDPDSVIVACVGAYGDQGKSAGLIKVHVDEAGRAEISQSFRVADHEEAANVNSNIASLGGDIVVAVASGHVDPETMRPDRGDRLFRVDLSSGEQTELWVSRGAFALGSPGYDATSRVLLVPDAGDLDQPSFGLQRFRVSADREVSHSDFVEVAPDTGLAARQVLAL